jgi:hypothetical protein
VYIPDVVQPQTPSLLEAVGGAKLITLRWQRSADPKLHHYQLYRASSDDDADDLRAMTLVARIAPEPTANPAASMVAPVAVATEPGRLELPDTVPAGTTYHYRLTTLDGNGNRSDPSAVVSGRAYQAPPAPPVLAAPVWDAAHTTVSLAWTLPDSTLEPMVERRRKDGMLWRPASTWLPAGTSTLSDQPPEPSGAFEYRVKVRDRLGQVNATHNVVSTP